MASVTFKRTNNIDSVPIVDGQLIFDTSDQKIYLDNGNTREVYGGGSGTDLISNVSDATDNNAFNANATVNLFTRKSSIVDTKAEIQSVTQAGVPLGCKGFNEVIGTGDISELGDGSVTGAILANKSAIDTLNQNLTKINTTTKTLWGYINGVWTDLHIRAYYDAIPVFVNGELSSDFSNGGVTLYGRLCSPFTLSNSNLICNTTGGGTFCIFSTQKINVTAYTKITFNVNGATKSVNISDVNGDAYVGLFAYQNANPNTSSKLRAFCFSNPSNADGTSLGTGISDYIDIASNALTISEVIVE